MTNIEDKYAQDCETVVDELIGQIAESDNSSTVALIAIEKIAHALVQIKLDAEE